MAATAKRTFSLPDEQAKFIDKQVKSGGYASGSEVVRAGLRALQERDAAIERCTGFGERRQAKVRNGRGQEDRQCQDEGDKIFRVNWHLKVRPAIEQ